LFDSIKEIDMKSLIQMLIALSLGATVLAGCSKEEAAPAEAAPAADAAAAPAAAPEPVKEEPGGWVPPPADAAPAAPAEAAPAADAAAPVSGS